MTLGGVARRRTTQRGGGDIRPEGHPSAPSADPDRARVLALQRSAGNRATTAAVRQTMPDDTEPVDAEPVGTALTTGREDLAAATTEGETAVQQALADHATTVDSATGERTAQVTAALAQARTRVLGTVAAAQAQLRARAARQRAAVEQARVAQGEQATRVVTEASQAARTQSRARGDEAVQVAEQAGANTSRQVDATAARAGAVGRERGASATDENPDAVRGMRRAAGEVSAQTAEEVRRAVGATAQDLRRVGPEVRGDVLAEGDRLVAHLDGSLGPLRTGLDTDASQATATLDTVVAQGMSQLTGIGSAVSRAIAALNATSTRGLRAGAQAAKQTQARAATEAVSAVRAQAVAADEGGRQAAEAAVAHLLSRRGRRRIGRALAAEAATQLRHNFGLTAAQARDTGHQVAGSFRAAAASVSAVFAETAGETARHAGSVAADASGQLTAAQSALVARLEDLVSDVVARGEQRIAGVDGGMRATLADADSGLATSLGRLRAELDARGTQAVTQAAQPVESLGGRVDEAMTRARVRANEGWLAAQLHDIGEALSNPGFWAGLVVGLLVTIAVVAICGTGIGAIILAGALAGAASVAATTLTEHATGRRQGPVDWGRLGQEMLVGAVFGAVGGAVGAGTAAGVLGRQVLSGAVQATARQVVVNRVAQVVVGTGLGVAQNVLSGPGVSVWDPATWNWAGWDRGLLLNAGINVAMTSRTAERAIGSLAEGARGYAVDRGVALNVTAAEAAAATARAAARAGADPATPVAGDGSPVTGEGSPVTGEGSPVAGEGGVPVGGRTQPTSEPMSSGAKTGEAATEASVRRGSVRMEDHPNYQQVLDHLRDKGFTVVQTSGDPHVVVRRVLDTEGRVIAVELEVHVRPGMRFLDLEHEVGHVNQVTDTGRFPDGPPATEVVTQRPDGSRARARDQSGILTSWQDPIVEYHNRLQEYVWLAERGADPALLAEHAAGVDLWQRQYFQKGLKGGRSGSQRAWAERHFPDIGALEQRVRALRAASGGSR
ncbi:hypothetical protein SUDANB95_01753 [Actinosynnema sp. ALI-1.44]